MVILFSSIEHTCLWSNEQILYDGYLQCKCFLKEDMWASCDIRWKPGPESCMLSCALGKKSRKCFMRDSWVRSHSRRNRLHILSLAQSRDVSKNFKSFISGKLLEKHYLVGQTFNGKSVHERMTTASRKDLDARLNFVTRNHVVEEPWLLQSSPLNYDIEGSEASSISISDSETVESINSYTTASMVSDPPALGGTSSSKHEREVTTEDQNHESFVTFLGANYPVEEPWLSQQSISFPASDLVISPDVSNEKMSIKEMDNQAVPYDQHEQIPDNILPDNGSTLISKEDIVTTVILINSSICTMQRIAVLENEKLVELLLEPVKNNVQCDSVYLGAVTKLVPHMGGAFVNIGCSRPSFMDINPRREPFIAPSYHHQLEEGGVNSSMFSQLGQDVAEDERFADELHETDDIEDHDVEDDDIEIDSVEYMNDAFVENARGRDCDTFDDFKRSQNGSVIVNGVKTGSGALENLNGNGYQKDGHIVDIGDNNDNVMGANGNKWAQVKKGTKIIVQVVKEGLGSKGPTLTAYPKLRSRFWILIARSSTIGISKKISGMERTRLRVIAKTLQPPGFGLTVRTVASGHSLEELQKDLEGLLSTWKSITEHARSAALASDEGVDGAVPVMLHRAMGQTLSVVQDYFTDKVTSMIVDSPRTYYEVTGYLQEIAPNLCDRVELYSKKTPLFDEYRIEEEIDNMLSKRISLDNGGYLVIEQTEALVSIDVNGGHCMLGQGTSQEKAILDVNIAAAKQIARELRLRDIGGIIVVDFIDMLDDSNKRLVYEEVKKAVERDRSTVKVSELSRHGLMEITRKRVRPSVTFMISEPCACCHGTGRVEALETSFSKIEHEICRMLSLMDKKADAGNPKSWPRFILRVDRYMCNYLTSGKRTRLAALSSSLKVWILLKVVRGLTRGAFELKPLTNDKEYKQQQQPAIPLLRAADIVSNTPGKRISLFPKKWKTSGK